MEGLALAIVSVIKPALPVILGAVTKGALEELGAKIFSRLSNRKPALDEAAKDLAKHPDDTDAEAALRYQVRKLLEEDHSLAEELRNLLAQGQKQGVFAEGERSVAVGGNVSGSTIVTGDAEVTQEGS